MNEKYDPILDKKFKKRLDKLQTEFEQNNPDFKFNKWNAYQMVKDYVQVPTLFKLIKTPNDVEDLNFDELPDNFVIKSAMGVNSRYVLCITRNNNAFVDRLHKDKKLSKSQLRSYIKAELTRMKPQTGHPYVMIEEFLGGGPDLPRDVKIYTVKGKVEYITILDRNDHHVIKFTDRDWNTVPMSMIHHNRTDIKELHEDINILLPDLQQREMLVNLAEKLAKEHQATFCRYDFYCIDDDGNKRIVFGEITTKCGGLRSRKIMPKVIKQFMN